jgi:hypothetical protein
MKRKHVSILSYYTFSSVGSSEPEHVEPEAEPQPDPEHVESQAKPECEHEPDPQIVESNATTFDEPHESTNQPSQLIQELHPSQNYS